MLPNSKRELLRKTTFSLYLSGTISKPDYLAAADDNTVYSGDTLGCLDSSKHLPLPPPFGAPEFGSLTLQSEDELIYAAVGPPTNTASTVVFQHHQLDQQLVIQNRQQLLPLLSQPSFPTQHQPSSLDPPPGLATKSFFSVSFL